MRTGVDKSGKRRRMVVDVEDDFNRCSASFSKSVEPTDADAVLLVDVVDECPVVVVDEVTLGAGEPSI